jgi:hypothetical protein
LYVQGGVVDIKIIEDECYSVCRLRGPQEGRKVASALRVDEWVSENNNVYLQVVESDKLSKGCKKVIACVKFLGENT